MENEHRRILLIVDDEGPNREILEEYFKDLYLVVCADSGVAARNFLSDEIIRRKLSERIARVTVLTDQMMESTTAGEDLLDWIKKEEPLKDVSSFLMTGMPLYVSEVRRPFVIQKPVNIGSLYKLVREAFAEGGKQI